MSEVHYYECDACGAAGPAVRDIIGGRAPADWISVHVYRDRDKGAGGLVLGPNRVGGVYCSPACAAQSPALHHKSNAAPLERDAADHGTAGLA